MGSCNCESLVCKMPHADGSRESLDLKAWHACPNDSLDDFRILYIGPVCRGCYESYPAEYRMTRNPTVGDWWGGDFDHAVHDLDLYIENTGELYGPKKRILADPRVYDPNLAPLLWLSWVNLGAQMYVHEMILEKPLSRFYRHPPPPALVEQYIPLPIREEVARQVAEHEMTRLKIEQGYAPPIKRVVYTGRSIKKNPRRVVYRSGGAIQAAPDCGNGELQQITGGTHGYALGSTRIWYMRPEFARDGMMGVNWLKQHGIMPDTRALAKTHVCIGLVEETYLEAVFRMMQGENWSPNGEARYYIKARGLQHTSMSVGDVVEKGGRFYIVDSMGFVEFT